MMPTLFCLKGKTLKMGCSHKPTAVFILDASIIRGMTLVPARASPGLTGTLPCLAAMMISPKPFISSSFFLFILNKPRTDARIVIFPSAGLSWFMLAPQQTRQSISAASSS
jgi:hypothetical protein